MELNQEQLMIRDQAQRLLKDSFSAEKLKGFLDADEHLDRDLWHSVVEMGWPAITIPEQFDGLGMSLTEVCLIAEELGRVAAAIPLISSITSVTEALIRWGNEAQRDRYLPRFATGELIGALAFAEGQESGIPTKLETHFTNGKLAGKKTGVVGGAVANTAVVYAATDGASEGVLVLVDLDGNGIERTTKEYLDNNRNIADINFNEANAQIIEGTGKAALQLVLDIAAIASAFEQIGSADVCLEMAREYALERQAFGQPIAKFQAVKHNLVNMYAYNQLARGCAYRALDSISKEDPIVLSRQAAAARLGAIKASDHAGKENIQIHGGIGVTWEADCHLYYRRGRSLSIELGGAPYWRSRLIAALRDQSAEKDSGFEPIVDPQTPAETYRQKAREFLAKHAPNFTSKKLAGLSEKEYLVKAREWMALLADNGYACIPQPQEFGGGGGTHVEKVIFGEEELRYDTPSSLFIISQNMPVPIMLKRATEEQKLKYVPPAIRGETIWCQLFSEPAAGSDLAGLRMSARKDGDNWIFNGQKVWTSHAQHADYGIIIVRTDPKVPKHAGLTFFFIDMRSQGIEVRPIRKLHGESEINEVFFNDVVVPDNQRLGEVGEGFRVALETLMLERFSASDVSGYGPKITDYIDMAVSASVDGQPAIEDGAVQHAIAEAYIEEQGLTSIKDRAFAALVAGEEPGPEGAIHKLTTISKQQRLSSMAMDWMGASGLEVPPDPRGITVTPQNTWLSILSARIAGGTDETLRNTIAERVLGLPQDYRPDKGLPFDQIGKG